MTKIDIFDGPHLENNLEEAIAENCQFERCADGTMTIRYRDISGIRVLHRAQGIQELSEQLRKLSSPPSSVTPDLLAPLMVEVAIFASHMDIQVIGPSARWEDLNRLRNRITADFALKCSLSLAGARGHSIAPEKSQREIMRSVITVKDDDSLVRIFRDSLTTARVPRSTDLALSAQSFWNLVSQADVENWNDSVILRLIEEYLSLALNPHFAHYTNEIFSGEEWRQLYYRIHGRPAETASGESGPYC
jgi:hypothetical protein